MDKIIKDFIKFVKAQGVVSIAVGIAIGIQVTSTVSSIVTGFINPIVSFIVGDTKGLESATWTVVKTSNRELVFGWGSIVSSSITLLAVAFVVFYMVKALKLDKK